MVREKPKRDKPDFQKEVIRILRPVDSDKGMELAVIRWIRDGRATAPQLVNQEIYTDRIDGKRKHGKVKGLKWGDWKFLTEDPKRISTILELLADRPQAKEQSFAKERAAGDDTYRDESAAVAAPAKADLPF